MSLGAGLTAAGVAAAPATGGLSLLLPAIGMGVNAIGGALSSYQQAKQAEEDRKWQKERFGKEFAENQRQFDKDWGVRRSQLMMEIRERAKKEEWQSRFAMALGGQ